MKMIPVPRLVAVQYVIFLLLIATGVHAQTVYVCEGPYATKYHCTPSCRGLNNCRGGLSSITLQNAVARERYPCSICGGNCSAPIRQEKRVVPPAHTQNREEPATPPERVIQPQEKMRVQKKPKERNTGKTPVAVTTTTTVAGSTTKQEEIFQTLLGQQEQLDERRSRLDSGMMVLQEKQDALVLGQQTLLYRTQALIADSIQFERDKARWLADREDMRQSLLVQEQRLGTMIDSVQAFTRLLQERDKSLALREQKVEEQEQLLRTRMEGYMASRPRYFSFEMTTGFEYLLSSDKERKAIVPVAAALLYRFDHRDNIANRFGVQYRFGNEYTISPSWKSLGYRHEIVVLAEFNELIRIGGGYTVNAGQSVWALEHRYSISTTVFFHRSSIPVGITGIIYTDNEFSRARFAVGMQIGYGINFLQW